jgi:hypothetical protein
MRFSQLPRIVARRFGLVHRLLDASSRNDYICPGAQSDPGQPIKDDA